MIVSLISQIESIIVINIISIVFGRYKTACSVAYTIGIFQCFEMKYYPDHFTIRDIVETSSMIPFILIGLYKYRNEVHNDNEKTWMDVY